tara:strand:+ start:51 stop:548 length:498 start_codon:yes stop_codon:yes gene_type:complete
MWFNIVKLDLSQIAQVQGDAEGKNINIEENRKCREKIERYSKDLKKEFGRGLLISHYGTTNKRENPELPEHIYCWIVENLDKFFSSEFKENRHGNLEKKVEANFEGYTFKMRGEIHNRPETFNPLSLSVVDVLEAKSKIAFFLGDYKTDIAKDHHKKMKVMWERL